VLRVNQSQREVVRRKNTRLIGQMKGLHRFMATFITDGGNQRRIVRAIFRGFFLKLSVIDFGVRPIYKLRAFVLTAEWH
jgi:hypothetical protein